MMKFMHNHVILFDLEKNMPTAKQLRSLIADQYSIYLFNRHGQFKYALADLTEFAQWLNCGQVVILETPRLAHKEFEYAAIVGQLLALLAPHTSIKLSSALASRDLLLQMLNEAQFPSELIVLHSPMQGHEMTLPSREKILQTPALQWVKSYCDALAKMTGKPNNLQRLKNSIANVLQLDEKQVDKVLGMLINLRIVKKCDAQIQFRKKVLQQWLDLEPQSTISISPQSSLEQHSLEAQADEVSNNGQLQANLWPNFSQIDPVQIQILKTLDALKHEKPKDIYALRDLLVEIFPQSDVRLLLKELMEKGYIYWNGHQVIYSYEMFLH